MAERARPFHTITPFTMLDFPDRTACILWVAGCNMRCGYCHNPRIVLEKGTVSEAEALDFLHRRKGLLDGVVLSGGEATSWRGLARFAAEVKALGFAVKLDTNGLRPDVVARRLAAGLVDPHARDYKAPPGRFRAVTGTDAWRKFSATLDLLCAQQAVPFDVRTTVHDALLDERDVLDMADDLAARGYRGPYAIQQAIAGPGRPTLGDLPPPGPPLDTALLAAASPVAMVFR
jgi:pyruvate formate lyase activating enzyme